MGRDTSEDPIDPGRRAFLKALGVITAASGSAVGMAALLGSTKTTIVAAPPTVPSSPDGTGIAGPTTTSAPSPTSSAPSTTTPPVTTTTTELPLEALRLEVISKSGWGARNTGSFESHVPERLTYHHTASAASDPAGAPARIRGYQRYHLDQGRPDVAYHYLIDQTGRVYEGRPVLAAGDTFTEYEPSGHFLPCLDGNFDVATPSAASIDALVLVLAWASQTYGIDARTLSGHRDLASTTCPGDNLYAMRDEIARRVSELVTTGPPVELALVDSIT